MQAPTRSSDELLHELQVHQIELEMQNEELRSAHIALEQSRARYLSLYEFAPVGYLTLNRAGLIEEINLTGAALFGVERKQLINRRFAVLVTRQDSDRWYLMFRRMMQCKEEHNFELELQRGDNSVFHAQLHCLPMTADGQTPMARITLTDITERKRIEQDKRIAAVAFESQESMVICDVNNIILRVNKAFSESTGYTAEEIVGQKMSLLKSGRHDAAFYNAMWASINQTGTWQGEIWDRHKNGEIRPKLGTLSAVKDAAGSITHYVCTYIDITERKLAEEEIKQLAFYDQLTRLPNRRLLQERLKHGIEAARRDDKQMALLMLDLDSFKAVNDSFGHSMGDELLQQVASRMKARLRNVDMVARLGGDEFVVLLEEITHPDDAARVAEEIIAELRKPFNLILRDDVRIGASIGISLYPQHGDSPQILMDHADAALYLAKSQGRGRFAYFSAELTRTVQARIALEARLRIAIGQGELQLYYQPQMDMASDRIIGAEALVRWLDPVEGLILPSRFIPVAEETRLITEIGAWVLREACKQGRQWLDGGLPPLTMTVNVSPHQFRRSNINSLIAAVLAETGFPAGQLELEITETGLMENHHNAMAILNNLRNQRICLASDSFGTGYSSLASLKRFPLDVLKIDKSFINGIPHNQDGMEIATAIVALGHTLGLKVMAEGVETPEQLAFLRKTGCDTYQGFIKIGPVPTAEFAELLRGQQGGG